MKLPNAKTEPFWDFSMRGIILVRNAISKQTCPEPGDGSEIDCKFK